MPRPRPGYVGRVFGAFRSFIATLSGTAGNAYNSADSRRKFLEGWRAPKATANESLVFNLSTLINQCRHIARNTPLGRAVSDGFKADVVGTGISVLAKTKNANAAKALDAGFLEWAESCGVNGESLWELQHQGAGEIPEAGAVLWRLLIMPERIDLGLLPLAILPLEVEWLSEVAVEAIAEGNVFVRGIEQDKLGRPRFYHIRNPEMSGQYASIDGRATGERVPASEIIHCFERRRPMQTHGEPALAPAVERIQQDGELVNIELKAANNTASMAVAITSETHDDATDDDGEPVNDIPLGATVRLYPGEDAKAIHMERPNQLLPPFRATIRGDVAACTRQSQFWLDRDASRANYSNARMDQLISKRLLNPIKLIIGKHLAGVPFQRVAPYILLRAGIAMPRNPQAIAELLSYELRPDQPEYVDPQKDAEAAAFLVQNNLSTLEKELSNRGMDMSTVLAQRAKENALLSSLGLPVPGSQPANAPQKQQSSSDGSQAANSGTSSKDATE